MIREFQGEWRFLSNFWPVQIWIDGMKFASVEHAFQAAKTLVPEEKIGIRNKLTPGQAKRAAKFITLRPDWFEIREQVMEELVRQKFTKHKALQLDLLATGEQDIVEGNTWHDVFWGVCNCETHKGQGENILGKILMKIRKEIK
jgi:ribA/ribD-fused uncharacterized protein